MNRLITIQPFCRNGKMPYPWIAEENGNIKHQKFWKGDPFKFIGLTPRGKQELKISIFDMHANPELCKQTKGMHPVFAREDGHFYTICKAVKITMEDCGRGEAEASVVAARRRLHNGTLD